MNRDQENKGVEPESPNPEEGTAALDAQLNEAVEYHRAGHLAEAEEIYRRILAVDPDYPYALCLLGNIAQAAGEYDQAADLISKAISVKPDYADAYCNLGAVLMKQLHFEKALACFENAIALAPENVEAHSNKGVSLRWLNRPKDAIDSYRQAIALRPDYAEAHHNLSYTLLALGQKSEGLDEYEWRWRSPFFNYTMREYARPMWDGSTDLSDKNLLVWPEQGPGDLTIWASGIPEIISRTGHCIIETAPKLVSLFARSFPRADVRPENETPDLNATDFDVHLPLGSLFRHLQQDPAAPCDAYLVPDPDRVAFWKQRLASLGPGPYVGISWKSPLIKPDRTPNYTQIDDWAPLFALPAQFINLECSDSGKDLARAREHLGTTVHDFEDLDLFDGLDDVAALTAALDVVISVSTAVAPIAAGAGTPVWLIAWRQSPWSNFLLAARGPEVTWFERNLNESWDAVFAALAERLRGLAEK